ncbi:MAG: hypothetical protein WDW38_008632 [Sanguina aurantia]
MIARTSSTTLKQSHCSIKRLATRVQQQQHISQVPHSSSTATPCASARRATSSGSIRLTNQWRAAASQSAQSLSEEPAAEEAGEGEEEVDEDAITENFSAQTGAEAGDPEARAFAIAMAKVADGTRCTDIVVLDVAPIISWTSFLVIATVYSKPQLLAALARMEDAAETEFDTRRQNMPGSSPWEVLDFGEVCVHLFTAEQREYYDLESFYAAAPEVDLPFGNEPEKEVGTSSLPQWSTRF